MIKRTRLYSQCKLAYPCIQPLLLDLSNYKLLPCFTPVLSPRLQPPSSNTGARAHAQMPGANRYTRGHCVASEAAPAGVCLTVVMPRRGRRL